MKENVVTFKKFEMYLKVQLTFEKVLQKLVCSFYF